MVLIQGTTPTIIINIKNDINFSQIAGASLIISQRDKIRVHKDIADITVNPIERRIKVLLTQEDTLNLREGDAIIQVRILMSDGTALASIEKEIGVIKTQGGEISSEEYTPEQWTVGPEPTIERIRLNLIPVGAMPICHASQFDKKRQIEIELYNGAQPYFLSDEVLELDIKKPDGNLVTMNVPYDVGSNSVIFETTEQACAVAGKCLCELRVTKGEKDLGSLNFYLEVESSPSADGVPSGSEINNLTTQIEEITEQVVGENYYNKTQIDTALDTKADASAIPTKTSQLQNDSGFAQIDDSEASASKTYSSNKVDIEFSSVKNDFKTEDDVINHNITSMLYSGNLNDGNIGFKRGRVNLSTGEYMDATTKKALVDKNYEPIELKSNSIVLHIATGYKTRGVILNPDKSYNNFISNFSTGGTVAELQNKKGYFVMLYIEKTDGTDISDNELATANEQTLYIEAVLGLDSGILGEFDKKANLKDFTTETEVINQNILSMLYNGNLNDGNIGYKKGSVNLLTGEYISPNAKKSIVDKDFKPIELKSNTIVIHIGSAYKTRGVILNPDKSYNSYFAGWSTGGTVDALQNKKGYYVMLVVERIDGADITDQEREAANEKTMYIEAVLGLETGIVGEITKNNKAFTGKTIVNFGDSLFGNFRDDNVTTHKSISKMISENTGATVYNAGFGGCRMSERLYGATFWNAFAMYSLADSVYSEDWSVQDQALIDGAGTIPDYFADTVAMLKTIDFSEVDIITISYGTNDYTGETPLTGSGVEYQNYEGALRYSLRKLLSKYPSMRIVVLSPAWRFWYSSGTYSYSSDDEQSRNNNGDLLTDFVASCDDVCKEYHIPYVDMYNNLGFNQYSCSAYFSDIDSTHPIQIGRQLMADRISGQLSALLHH